jgi:hypothetical protein
MSPPSRGAKQETSRRQVSGKVVPLSFDGLHSLKSQDIGLFITTAMRFLFVGEYYLGSLVYDF